MRQPTDSQSELKYVFTNAAAPRVSAAVYSSARPDPEYRKGQVNSVYFDSPGLHLLMEKIASDYIKTKVRLRWYGPISEEETDEVLCFLEVKRKVGSVRQKTRLAVELPSAELRRPFTSEKVRRLASEVSGLGFSAPFELIPLVAISYQRRRYVDVATDSRISIDTNIRCSAFNPRVLASGSGAFQLNEGVLEVKGQGDDLPPRLQTVGALVHKCAFSKYERCLVQSLRLTQ